MRTLITAILLTTLVLAQEPTTVPMPGHKHAKRTIIIGFVAGAGVGAVIAILQRHPCPDHIWYDGKKYPYDGTAPCPGPDYVPGKIKLHRSK